MYNAAYVFYLLISALYLFSSPLSWYLNNKYDQIANFVFIYSLISFVVLLFVPILLHNFKRKNVIEFKQSRPALFKLKFVILSFITILILQFLYLHTEISHSIFFNRVNRELPFYRSQLYVFFIILMQFYFFIFIYNSRYLKYFEKIILFLLFLLFAYHEIVLTGARRFTLSIILFYFIYKFGFKKLFQIKYITLAFFLALFLFVLGGVRELIVHGKDVQLTEGLIIALANNEFTEMGRGLYFYMSKNINGEILQGGKTFIDGLQFIIPREIHPDKPISIPLQFGSITSIYSELFLNFHFFGALMVAAYGVFYYILSLKHGFWTIVFFSYTLDFIRTQFGVILYTIVILYFLYFVFYSKYRREKN
jgi:hypothetical protein